jgi:hypothetical protein
MDTNCNCENGEKETNKMQRPDSTRTAAQTRCVVICIQLQHCDDGEGGLIA